MSGRGRGRGSRAARGRSGSVPSMATHVPEEQTAAPNSEHHHQGISLESEHARTGANNQDGTSDAHPCGMCGHEVGDDAIGCDRCSSWVHPSEMCSGLPNEVIKSISTVRGDAILFVCTNCRAKPPPSGVSTRQGSPGANCSDQLIQQLFLSVKGICSAVMELTARIDKAFSRTHTPETQVYQSHPAPSQGSNSNSVPPNLLNPDPASPSGDYRTVTRQEMREMQERSKRRQSVIIKGIQAQSARQLVTKFGDLSESFAGTRVELSDVMPITNHSDLYRAKILNKEHCRLVLDRAKRLRDTEHATVFIRRDLTYIQRKELRDRRAQRSSEGSSGAQGSEISRTHAEPSN